MEMEKLLQQVKVFFELCAGQLSGEEFDRLMESTIKMLVALRSQKSSLSEQCSSPLRARFEAMRYAYKSGARMDSKFEGSSSISEVQPLTVSKKDNEKQPTSKTRPLGTQDKKEVKKKNTSCSVIKEQVAQFERQGRGPNRKVNSPQEKLPDTTGRLASPEGRRTVPQIYTTAFSQINLSPQRAIPPPSKMNLQPNANFQIIPLEQYFAISTELAERAQRPACPPEIIRPERYNSFDFVYRDVIAKLEKESKPTVC
eukprot:TRINITY_DN4613_c0_g2_i1.p1 TRINITY_DN4613_c0_g2~~TRINITY_DN4613_c0_g2_i1.p1  ORF type:complete len:256 (+),score=47.90 TRINITY_DN4613_c0_g2_i1:137-904(+)